MQESALATIGSTTTGKSDTKIPPQQTALPQWIHDHTGFGRVDARFAKKLRDDFLAPRVDMTAGIDVQRLWPGQRRIALREDPWHQLAGNVGQTEIAPLKWISELFVVEPEQMQDGRLKIMYRNRVLDDRVA